MPKDSPIKPDKGGTQTLRLDTWLFFARFFKSRALAAELCESGKLRLSGSTIDKAHARLRVGDVLTFPQGRYIRVVKVLALAERRGPAPEARALYEDLSPPEDQPPLPAKPGPRAPGTGRPTKRDRRTLMRIKESPPEGEG
jgi:ribosome-associated heat shock protein Hsp15